jgi:hypothetical protein
MNSSKSSLLLLLLVSSFAPAAEPAGNLRSRQEFAQKMDKIKEDMSMAEVRALLGPPDDIQDDRDPGNVFDQCQIWRYGTSGHLTTATLGAVGFDRDGRVTYEVFGTGKPKAEGLFTEQELRRLLTILDNVTPYHSANYNPLTVIRAVNALQPLSKEKVLAVIEEFVRVIEPQGFEHGDVCSVLRVLFDVPDDPGMPDMFAGARSPENKKLLPRYPICTEGDIPFLLTDARDLDHGFGPPPNSLEHVDYFRRHGRLRARPLQPTDKPWDALTAFEKSPRWKAIAKRDQEDQLFLLQYQMLTLLDSVYQFGPDRSRVFPWGPKGAAQRQKTLSDVASLKIHWNPSENRYTFLDGKSLPPRPVKVYRREVWIPEVPGRRVKFSLARESSRDVSVEIMERGKSPRSKLVFKLYNVGDGHKSIGEFRQGEGNGGLQVDGSVYETYSMSLPEGVQVKAELLLNNKLQTSPTLKP